MRKGMAESENPSGYCGAANQRLFVMRHGERLDTMDPSWKRTAIRVYDTPITKKGEFVAFRVAKDRFLGHVSALLSSRVVNYPSQIRYTANRTLFL